MEMSVVDNVTRLIFKIIENHYSITRSEAEAVGLKTWLLQVYLFSVENRTFDTSLIVNVLFFKPPFVVVGAP